jgi:histidinol phosphatase-like enzyme
MKAELMNLTTECSETRLRRKHGLHINLSYVIVTNQKLACQSSYQPQTFVKPENTMEAKLLNLQTYQPGLQISERKVATTLRIPL